MTNVAPPADVQRGCPVIEETDPVEEMIEKTGCAKLHYALQECMYEKKDWRQCQDLVKQFRECMSVYEQTRVKNVGLPR